jgi:hypothetical protein
LPARESQFWAAEEDGKVPVREEEIAEPLEEEARRGN